MNNQSWMGMIYGVIGAICILFLSTHLHGSGANTLPPETETAYEHVMRTQTIRCGYGQWPPFISKDIKTGEFSGIFYDYMESLGKALNLKIEWTEEFGTGDFAMALKTHRIDATCGSVWQNASRAREMDFIRPIYFTPIYAYARQDDKRFDTDISALNSPTVKIVSMDGEMASLIADSDFPLAQKIQLPQLSSVSEFFINIAMKKADVTFSSPTAFMLYNSHNPDRIRRIPSSRPIRVFGNTIAIATGEDKLRRMLDTATDELLSNGTITKILAQNRPYSDGFLEVTIPYKNEEALLLGK